jgi:hypothetical protein
MRSTMALLKALAMVDTPMSAVGLSASTASARVAQPGCSCAKASLWCARSLRPLTTRPLLSTYQQRLRASSMVQPASSAMADAMRLPMPTPASPAPRNRMVWSLSCLPVMRIAENRPARVTAAVPWMSSLKVRTFSR